MDLKTEKIIQPRVRYHRTGKRTRSQYLMNKTIQMGQIRDARSISFISKKANIKGILLIFRLLVL